MLSLLTNIAVLFLGIKLLFVQWRAWRRSYLAARYIGLLLILLSVVAGLVIYGANNIRDTGLTLFFAIMFFLADKHELRQYS